MAITGYLRSFSLAELLRVLTHDHKTGLLTVCGWPQASTSSSAYYLWLEKGRILAAGHGAYQPELLDWLEQQRGLSLETIWQFAADGGTSVSLGEWLREHDLVPATHLREQFYSQVMETLSGLLQLQDGWFQFEADALPPVMNMTGFSTSMPTVMSSSLRGFENWSLIAHHLPDPQSKVLGVSQLRSRPRFTPLEWQVWEFATGTMTLSEIAQHLRLSIETVLQVACRLIMTGFAEEIPATNSGDTGWSVLDEAWSMSEQGISMNPSDWLSLSQLLEFLKEL